MNIRIYQIDADKDIHRVKFDSFESMKKYSGLEQPDASIYENVYEGKVNAKDLEDVYRIFNTGGRPGEFRGHSLSKSDIVEVISSDKIVGTIHCSEFGRNAMVYTDLIEYSLAQENLRDRNVDFEAHDYVGLNTPSIEPGFYFCDSFGFKKVEFDSSLTFKRDDLIKVVMIDPGEEARVVELDPSLRAMQCAVSGHIEAVTLPVNDNVRLICNDEGKLWNLPPNRALRDPDSKEVIDVVVGTCFVCGVKGGEFIGLSNEQLERYKEMFLKPQEFTKNARGEWQLASSLASKISNAENRLKSNKVTSKEKIPGREER